MKQLAAHVYCNDEHTAPPDFIGSVNSYVTTLEGLVLIDTPFMPRRAMEWRDYLAKIDTIKYIIHTDQHIDHIAGNAVLEGTVVAHRRVRELFLDYSL
jgi:glyoxylase-like metal-dependent hydrolase (beta-lactamase superfamily II)